MTENRKPFELAQTGDGRVAGSFILSEVERNWPGVKLVELVFLLD
jgi:hypothetical protein